MLGELVPEAFDALPHHQVSMERDFVAPRSV